MRILLYLIPITLFGIAFSANAVEEDNPLPDVKRGALVFRARCVLCHGNIGMGNGPLATTITGYPQSNLQKPRVAKTDTVAREIVVRGGMTQNGLSPLMPAWGLELSWTDIESIVLFLDKLRSNLPEAKALLTKSASTYNPSREIGQQVFRGRCAQCHGMEGRGNGRLSRIIKNPPPFNLTYSEASDDTLFHIIKNGGASIGRSPQMPAWGHELTDSDIKSVMLYIKEFRGRH